MNKNNLLKAASFSPTSLESPSAWIGHLPFAVWVMQEIAPKIFVELGTHSGNSYFSFCQSVFEASMTTKCYAVDTWQGDAHAGQYSDEMFSKVSAHNDGHYAIFSRLMRMTFDEAATHFQSESIELLHIDGLHTYAAVRHDFETWFPKLAPGAVVLFHDINVRERNFGVWKLWEELKEQYPSNLEFLHSHGLGVLQLNNAPSDRSLDWLQPNFPQAQQLINYFGSLGSWQLERYEFITTNTKLNQSVIERDLALIEREADNVSLRAEVNRVKNTVSWKITKPLRFLALLIFRPKKFFLEIQEKFGLVLQPLDKCALVPFGYPAVKWKSAPDLAVICHIFYLDIAEEFSKYLLNIRFPYDLFITTDTDEKRRIIEKIFSNKNGKVEIRIAPNRGRDIAPKLITFSNIYDHYEYILHIHTKKSPHYGRLRDWRYYLMETLLGSTEVVESVFDAFRSAPKLGMIAPQHFEAIRYSAGWGKNFEISEKIAQKMGIKISKSGPIDFPSGSMFWARTAALKPLLNSNFSIDDFPDEVGQVDETLAHAIERLFFFSCEQAGYRWLKISHSKFLGNSREKIVVADQESLLEIINCPLRKLIE